MVAAVACGGSSSGGGSDSGTNSDATIIWGTTDKPVSYDPAKAYDLPSWNVIYNVYQTLVRVDPATLKTVPDAAESCDPSKDFKTWTCTLKAGQKFSNGDPVTAQDVKFSFDRLIKINDPSGPAALLGDVKTEAKDDTTVVFHLSSPNALWNYIISTGAGAIVDSKVFPANKVLGDDQIIGSGPYQLDSYTRNQTAAFSPNEQYGGDLDLANGGVVINYYDNENTLKLDAQQGKVDVVYPGPSPTVLKDLAGDKDLNEVSGPGGAIRYMVFNLKTMPGANDAQKLAIRRAVAYTVDRQSIADNVYEGTVDPLYSMVPNGLDGHEDVYKTEYGATPDLAAAKKELQDAGVKTPVDLQLWWTPTHYGELSSDEYTELKRQLEESNLFKVDLQSTEWEQYTGQCLDDKCPAYQLGWFPDYPDTDDYVGVFYNTDSFFNDHYSDPAVDKLIKQEQGSTDATERTSLFKQIQEKTVGPTPTIPLWQGKQIAVTQGTVTGIKDTLLPDYIFRFWVLGKS